MRRRILVVLLAAAKLGACATSGPAADRVLTPLQPGWERLFRLDWSVESKNGRPVVAGYLYNDSPYAVARVQLLVNAVDPQGSVVRQRVGWVLASSMAPFSRAYFELAAPAPATRYQVQVFSYERLEGGPFDRWP
ncbi:MAG TPA: hypothetical protein VNO23_03400 [Candidatus Binatia bacterium]|nr:hypothetical protein [Candidatus Binatia bacterium]